MFMNHPQRRVTTPWITLATIFWILFVSWEAGPQALAASEEIKQTVDSAVERAQELSSETKAAVQERNPALLSAGAIVGWVLIGAMVGSIVGIVLRMKGGALALLANVAMGCVGAFVGGVIVQVGKLDRGWGSLTVSYEELCVSLVVGLLLIAVVRSILTRMAARETEKK